MFTCMTISVRNVNDAIFEKFKREAKLRNMNLGEAITEAMSYWMKKDAKKRLKLHELPTFDFGPGSENLSENVDEILYG